MGEVAPLSRKRSRRRSSSESLWRDYATGALPILGCFLGGATEKWAEGIVVALLPPQYLLGVFFNVVAAPLVACAAFAYLPARRFLEPAWRTALVNDLNSNLAPTLWPQPWITMGCFVSLPERQKQEGKIDDGLIMLRRFTAQPGAPAG